MPKKVFEADFWEHTQNHFRDHLGSSDYRDFWKYRRHHFPLDFQTMVEKLIALGPSAPLFPV